MKDAKFIKQGTVVRELDFAALHERWLDGPMGKSGVCPFVTPPWLSAWWDVFGEAYEPLLLMVDQDQQPIGTAPLMIRGKTAACIGSADLCDHADFPIVPGYEDRFTQVLIHYLYKTGIHRLVIHSVRPGSSIMAHLLPEAQALGCRVSLKPHGSALRMSLPHTWETYLETLSAKQRHEILRKLRRVDEAGALHCRRATGQTEVLKAMDSFVDLFRQSRPDKKTFMTPARERFFRLLAHGLIQADMLRLYCFTIDDQPAAVVFCVEADSTTYLYNNGFDRRFRSLSIGVVSKVLTIKASIAAGRQVYDFLNGTERYKYRLGGTQVPLSSCTIEW